jgi:hypothetical protein
MGNLGQKMVLRSQTGRHPNETEAGIFFRDEKLPTLHETTDWADTATGQWQTDELAVIENAEPAALVAWINPQPKDGPNTWLVMGVTAELALHGEDEKAKQFAQELLTQHPEAQYVFNDFFGPEITVDLLTPTTI